MYMVLGFEMTTENKTTWFECVDTNAPTRSTVRSEVLNIMV